MVCDKFWVITVIDKEAFGFIVPSSVLITSTVHEGPHLYSQSTAVSDIQAGNRVAECTAMRCSPVMS